ncbi:MAG: aspartate carbamoyltransferase [Planctomycetes bacterium SM23_32]|nr:MAG: aspartate carbamoyltransferase [Planctomycetes bacterium SM23_32]
MGSEKGARREMSVSAIRNGTVIDHIQNEATFKVAEILRLAQEQHTVLVGMNLPSGKVGKKGIIKIESRELTPQEVNKIALIAPQATLNIIQDYEVAEKRSVELPERVEGIVRCFNPSCITNRQAVSTCFDVIASDPVGLRCVYCERVMTGPDIILK